MKTSITSNLFLCGAVLAVGILGHTNVHAQADGTPLWMNRYNGPGNYADEATAIAVDGSGNVLVTGYSDGGPSSGSLYDYATIKYSNAGVPLWTNRYNGPGSRDDYALAIAVDVSGNVFVTGYSASTNTPPFNYDYATIAYSSGGVPLWTNRYNGLGSRDDYARAIAVDGSGDVFVTGNSGGTNGYYNYATIKYSRAGVALWSNRYHGPGNGYDQANAVAVDASGNVVVTGISSGGTNGYYDYATIAYSSAGLPLWTNRYNGPGNHIDEARAIAVDASGNVFVTGASYGIGPDYATIAYSSAGVPLWTNRYNGPGNHIDEARAIAVDASGNVVVTGGSAGSGSALDYATIKYSGAGLPLWTNRYKGIQDYADEATAIAVDSSGNVFVTGYSGGAGSYCTTVKYSGAGVLLWANRYNWEMGHGNAIAVDRSGNVFVAGALAPPYYDYVTIKYSGTGGPLLTIARTTTNTIAVSWPSPAADFALQQNTDLATTNWTAVGLSPTDDGTNKTVIVHPPEGDGFYRLFHP